MARPPPSKSKVNILDLRPVRRLEREFREEGKDEEGTGDLGFVMSPGKEGGGYIAVPNTGRRFSEGDAKTNSRFSHASQASHSTSRRDTIRVQTAEELGVSLEEYRQQLAQAKLIGAMKFMQMGKVGIEPNSVYGAAVLMPQLARTAHWHRSFIPHVWNSFFYLFVCMFVHATMLIYVSKELHVMNLFAGQPYLCDFGADLPACTLDEQSERCVGPFGTPVTAPRLYSWSQWASRSFVRDSMAAIFPEQEEEIRKVADPGEYGVESYYCRLLCCFVFVISITQELDNIIKMMRLLYNIPNEDQPWFILGEEDEDDSDENMEKWLNEVEMKVAGMSRSWKMLNVFMVLIPKSLLWIMTASTGINFLMETGGIDDIIVNSVALGFLLQLDEIITDAMLSDEVNHLLDECKEFPLYQEGDLHTHGDQETLSKLQAWAPGHLQLLWEMIPKVMVFCSTLLYCLVMRYYTLHCVQVDGKWVSKDMHLPSSLSFSLANALSLRWFPVDAAEKPYWSMSS
ncbi:unnamed protein product [Durusdinium trenchii]|uniref:Nitrate reductase [NADH] n=2 Tax=Durusdinium trenchii TaxID=1381693 RepID=A0ABP0M6M0_9DINO